MLIYSRKGAGVIIIMQNDNTKNQFTNMKLIIIATDEQGLSVLDFDDCS